jgi:hypothetical protein
MLRKLIFTVTVLSIFSFSVLAQERQVEVNVDLPAKGKLVASDIAMGGKVYLPLVDGRMVVEANINATDAFNLFLAPTTEISVSGKAWVYLTAKTPDGPKVRPFVFGGMTQNMFVGQLDETQATGGFGIAYERATGFAFIPSIEFTTEGLNGNQVLGKSFDFNSRLFIPLGKEFRLNITPYFGRFEPAPNVYNTRYGVKIGFGRVF